MDEYNEWDLTPVKGFYDKHEGEYVKLSCSCGFSFDKPLSIQDAPDGFIAKHASWARGEWKKSPKKGKKMVIDIYDPFCCRVGDTFSISMKAHSNGFGYTTGFVTYKLLSVKKIEKSWAKILVKVVEIVDLLQFVHPTTSEQAERIKSRDTYKFDLELGPKFVYFDKERSLTCIKTDLGGGDFGANQIIYTDVNDIDHWICLDLYGLDEGRVFFGDQILGHRSNRNWMYLLEKLML